MKIIFHKYLGAALEVFRSAKHSDFLPIHAMDRKQLITYAESIPDGKHAFLVASGFATIEEGKPKLLLPISFQSILNKALIAYEEEKAR